MSARRLVLALTFGWVAGCSLLAPSDEEALGGAVVEPTSEAGPLDGSRSDTSSSRDSASSPDSGDAGCARGVKCGLRCCASCNDGVCAGCKLNGLSCDDSDECCGGGCSSTSNKCGTATNCFAAGMSCGDTAACCAGLTCGYNNPDGGTGGSRSCQTCKQLAGRCAGSSDCCSKVCTNGMCAACFELSVDCNNDEQCCTGRCDKGHCKEQP